MESQQQQTNSFLMQQQCPAEADDSPMISSQPCIQQDWKETFSEIFYRNSANPRGGQENTDMGGGCGAGLMTVRNNQASRLEDFSSQPFKDTIMFHKNLSNLDQKIAQVNDNGRSRMMSDLAVGSSQQENRINVFHENFMQGLRKNTDAQHNTNGVLTTLQQQNSNSPVLVMSRQPSGMSSSGLLQVNSTSCNQGSNAAGQGTPHLQLCFGAQVNDHNEERFSDNNNSKYHPLTTGRKSQPYKTTLSRILSGNDYEPNKVGTGLLGRKLLSPQSFGQCAHSVMSGQALLSAGPGGITRGVKSNEKFMDRFIPCRLGENLQAKFEAVSQKYDEETEYNMDFRTNQLVQELGLNIDQPFQIGSNGGIPDSGSQGLQDHQVSQGLNHQASVNSAMSNQAGNGSSTNRSRGFSNIFGGLSTVDQVNGFALNRQASTNSNANNSAANPTTGPSNPTAGTSSVYPVLPNNNERDLQNNIQNYNNLLEQQIFNGEEEINQDVVTDEQRNLSIQSTGGNQLSRGASGFSMKENRSEISNQVPSKPITSGALSGKIFKFKKNTQQRDSSTLMSENQQNGKNPFTTNFLNLDSEHTNTLSSLNPFAPLGRKIPEKPYKVLDAPALSDDFYLNLVDWSQSNMLAVALGSSVYVWNAFDSSVKQLCELEGIDNQVTSVAWSQRGSHLCVGNRYGDTTIWDVNKGKEVRTFQGHLNRVGACSWNGNLIATGSRDRSILVRDIRAEENYQYKLLGHKQEVCGLKWSMHDENQIASGGNDNKLFIWQPMQNGDQPLVRFNQHQAAVKAIGWSPQQRGLLATGGGTADQCIRFWNTLTLQNINNVNTGSQVCNLMFSRTTDEIVSTHGYSLNQIIVWKYPTMEKISTLTGHTFRVLYLAMSPDGASIVTGAGDETLRFWNVFPKCKSNKGVVCSVNGLSSRGGDIGNVIGNGNSTLFPSNIDFR